MTNTIPAHGDMYTAAARRGGVDLTIAARAAQAAQDIYNRNQSTQTATTTKARSAALVTTETTSHSNDGAELARECDQLKQSEDWQQHVMDMQSVMWQITKVKSLAGCHRWRMNTAKEVGIKWRKGSRGRFVGLQNSHSVWGSPLAALGIIRGRRAEVQAALDSHVKAGGGALFMTLTLRHKRGHDLGKLWDALGKCWTKTTSGSGAWNGTKRYEGDKRRYGIAHWIKSVEVTTGPNGWHPHLHIIMLTERTLSDDEMSSLAGRMRERWINAALNEGLAAPSKARALDVQQLAAGATTANLAGYLTKGMISGLAAEGTGGQIKAARGDNRTPFQVLEDMAAAKAQGNAFNPSDVAIWHEWEQASHRRRFMAWSNGAKAALGIADLTDEEIFNLVEEQDDRAADQVELIAAIAPHDWQRVQSNASTRMFIVKAVEGAETAEQARRLVLVALEAVGISGRAVSAPVQHERLDALACLDSASGRPEVVRPEARSVLAD